MKKLEFGLFGLLCCLPLVPLHAQADQPQSVPRPVSSSTTTVKAWHPAVAVVFLEGMVALNGIMAAEIPGIYGGLMTLTSPLAASGRLSGAGAAAAIAATMALGQYNFNYVSRKSDAKRRRFWVTAAGLHVIPLLAYGTDCLAGGPACRSGGKAAVRGWNLYAFTAGDNVEFRLSRRF